jgi:Na+/H+-translocating membrane pyrophosphatase
MLPFWVAGGGIIAALVGFFFVQTKEGATQKELMFALHKGTIVACIVVLGLTAAWIHILFSMTDGQCTLAGVCFNRYQEGWRIYACIIIGLAAGVFIGLSTEYFTSYEYPMVR